MTSSLVGSEMCIRDSPRTVEPHLLLSFEEFHLPRKKEATKPECVLGAVAVSYTHLTLPTICSV
eukprot:4894050-Prorocentrum_lima.AAC.1